MASADRLIQVFEGARVRPAGPEREAWLDESCRDEPELRDHVRSLLEASDEAGDFLANSVVPAEKLLTERPGDRIGRYKLLKPIGEGGCGIVYMAEQEEPVRRFVALKVIKLGMDTREVVARFEAERQALAMMDHPNIAKVFDAGATDAGRPYFVMELVPGIKLTDYCDRNHLPTEERLQLFAQVCHAIQHAHQKGVIHRDIKPSNILVAESDGVAVPKVIDFGIAKATEQRLTARTVFTGLEQFIGTPAYMSPEQATMTSFDIDTRSDIYSLGVLLYELLTGRTPFDAGKLIESGIEEIRRTIREEEPLKPSTRLSALTQADLSLTAASRRTDPPKLLERVRGDLDWIALKCLEKDRTRRYETVSGLARDIEHYLHDEPVLATPPSRWYRFRKFIRRHKGPVAAGAMVLFALLAGIVGTTWGMLRAHRAEAVAVHESGLKSEKLWEALVAQARANRLTGLPGQRFETLRILDQAAQLARSLNLPPEKVHEMRNSVIAALALPDVHLTRAELAWPADGYAFAFDPSHTLYARTDFKGNCSIRRFADDKELHRLPGLGEPSIPCFSPDGNILALRHFNEPGTLALAIQVWALQGGPVKILEQPYAFYCAFRGPGEIILSCNDGTIRHFELPSGRELKAMAKETLEREMHIAPHPEEPIIAVASYFAMVLQIRDLRSGAVLTSLPQSHRISGIAWHPDGRTLAVAYSNNGRICLYDRTDWKIRTTLETRQAVTVMAFNEGGNLLAASGWGSVLELFELKSGQRLITSQRHWASATLFWKGTQLAGGVHDGRLGLWNVADGRELRTLGRSDPSGALVNGHAALHPNGHWLGLGHPEGIEIIDLITGRQLFSETGERGSRWLVFEPAGSLLVASKDGVFRRPVGNTENEDGSVSVGPGARLPVEAREGLTLIQSSDGTIIAGCNRLINGRESLAGGWILRADRPGSPVPIDEGADMVSISVSPNLEHVVTSTHTPNDAKLWNVKPGNDKPIPVKKLTDRGAGWPRFSPDGKWLSTHIDGGRVLDTNTWKAGPPVGLRGVFAPDSGLIAVLLPTGVRFVEHTTGREVAMLEDPRATVSPVLLFSMDGSQLITVHEAGGVHIWDLSLIRRQLKAMNLDWDWPEFPPEKNP